jgi:hypothetical protein
MQNERSFRVEPIPPGHGSGYDLTAAADQTVHCTGREITVHLRTGR